MNNLYVKGWFDPDVLSDFATKAITPAQISATSTVSGRVAGPKIIIPSPVLAQSTVSGSVRAIRRVAPVQISATSTCGGNVSAVRKIRTNYQDTILNDSPVGYWTLDDPPGTQVASNGVTADISGYAEAATNVDSHIVTGRPPLITNKGGPQLIFNNGTFERNVTLTGPWYANGAATVLTRDTTVFHSGIASMRVDVTAGTALSDGARTAWWRGSTMAAKQGDKITVSLYVKGTSGQQIVVQLQEDNGSRAYLTGYNTTVNLNGSWQQVSLDFTLAQATTQYVDLYIFCNQTTQTFWVDDVFVYCWNQSWAYGFDGTAAFFSVGDTVPLSPTGQASVEAWVNADTLATVDNNYKDIVVKNLSYVLRVTRASGVQYPNGNFYIGGSWQAVAATSGISTGQTYHLVTTYDGSFIRIYVNGVLVGTQAMTGSINDTTNNLNVGIGLVSNSYWDGDIDEVAVYDYALSSAQVASHYRAGSFAFAVGAVIAQSTVSGAIRVTRAVQPANISASSTMSGAVTARKLIQPTTVSATSTVSGSIRATRRVVPAQISATSTVNGSVAKRFRVVTTQISATSTVSGAVVVRRAVLPAQISATSTTSGSVGATRKITPTTISATSTVSGATTFIKFVIPAQISATSTVSARVKVKLTNARTFNGSSDRIELATGGIDNGYGTYLAVFRRNSTGFNTLFAARAAAGGNDRLQFYIRDHSSSPVDSPNLSISANAGATAPILNADGWVIAAITKTTGSVAPRIHRCILWGPTWTHVTSGNNLSDASAEASYAIGAAFSSSAYNNFFGGDIYCVARWSTALSDGQLEGIHGIQDILALNPANLWVLDQANTSDAVKDWMPTGANQTSISGTSVLSSISIVNFDTLLHIYPTQISSTASVSGSVIRAPRLIAPTTISATSTMSGSVRARKAVAGNIAATSTVTGNVAVRRPITAAQISATSTVTGLVRPLRAILPTQISATSTVTGAVIKRIRISGNVTATSTVTGNVIARRAIFPTTISATATVTGGVAKRFFIIVTTVSATSTVTGFLLRQGSFGGLVADATSTVSGTVIKRIRIAGNVAATATVTGNVIVRRRVFPTQISATSVVTGSVVPLRGILPAQIPATSTVTGRVVALRRILTTQISATSSVTGFVSIRRGVFPTTISATSTVTGRVVARRLVAGNITATSTVAGSIAIGIRRFISGAINAPTTVSGYIVLGISQAGNVSATSTVTGYIEKKVTGNIHAFSTVTGSVGRISFTRQPGENAPEWLRSVDGFDTPTMVAALNGNKPMLHSADGFKRSVVVAAPKTKPHFVSTGSSKPVLERVD
jgi:hypothetical protein